MSSFTVISFYTPDWKYPEHAQNLRRDCERLGLDHVIEQRPSTNTYVGNCNLKPGFIREQLATLKRPVLWLDVDGSIQRVPQELDPVPPVDVAAYASKQSPDRLSVNVLLFNPTPGAEKFLNTWCEFVKNSIDDGAFNQTVTHLDDQIVLQILPASQVMIEHSRTTGIDTEVCFTNRLSASDLKWQYKNRVEGRR